MEGFCLLLRLRMLLCLCPGVLTCFLISYAYAYALVKTSLKRFTHLAIQNASKWLATKNRLQQSLSNCSRSVVKEDPP